MSNPKKPKLKLETGGPKRENWDDTFRMMSWWDAEKVQASRVMVVGAGALGNEVLKNLALMNVGNILIVDFDTIEYANLCRSVLYRESDIGRDKFKAVVAAQRVRDINAGVKTMAILGDIGVDVGLGVFRRMDAVIGCLDNRIARLFINRNCFRVGKPWVDGAIENLAGQLNVYKPGISCYECQLTEKEWANIRMKMGCPDIAQRNSLQGKVPTTPISSSIIGALQVQEALKIIHNNEKQSLAGQVFQYEGMNNFFLHYKTGELREECESHIHFDPVIECKELSAGSTIEETLDYLIRRFEDKNLSIILDHEVILEITTRQSEISSELVVAKPHLSDQLIQKYQVVPGEDIGITESVGYLDKSFPKKEMRLREIGIPPLQILSVEANGAIYFVELTGDQSYLAFQ